MSAYGVSSSGGHGTCVRYEIRFPADTRLSRRWVLILINGVVFLFELTMPEPALEQFFYLFGIVGGPIHAPGSGALGWAAD